jgi:hypothetical protein
VGVVAALFVVFFAVAEVVVIEGVAFELMLPLV